MATTSRAKTLAAIVIAALCAVTAAAFVRLNHSRSGTDDSGHSMTTHPYLTAPNVTGDTLSGYLFRPNHRAADGATPTVVLVHGGGWLKGATAEYVKPMAQALARRGFVVWSLNYRRVGDGGGWPTTFTDVAAGIDHLAKLKDTAPEIDLTRVTVVGHSAGGQLAAWTAGRATLPAGAPGANPQVQPHGVVSLAGVLDMRLSLTKNDHVLKVLGGTPEQFPERYRLVDPLERVNPAVPVVAVTGTADTVVPPKEAAEYVDAMRARGGTAALIEIPAVGHGDVVDVRTPWWPTIEAVICAVAEHGPRAVPSARA